MQQQEGQEQTSGEDVLERQSNYLTPEQEAGAYSLGGRAAAREEIAQTHAEQGLVPESDEGASSLSPSEAWEEIDQTHSEYPNVVPPGVEPSSLSDLPQDQPAPPAAGPMPEQPPPISGLVDRATQTGSRWPSRVLSPALNRPLVTRSSRA